MKINIISRQQKKDVNKKNVKHMKYQSDIIQRSHLLVHMLCGT